MESGMDVLNLVAKVSKFTSLEDVSGCKGLVKGVCKDM